MIATADSKVNNNSWINIKVLIIIIDILLSISPIRIKSKWPAIILALNRTDKVIGRIRFLIDSIHTINGIRMLGVPNGIKWANIWVVLLIQPNNIKLIHKGKANENVKVKWLVDGKTYGNNLRKFLKKIKVNNEMNKREFFFSWIFNIVMNSFLKIVNNFIHIVLIRDGINHIGNEININPSIGLAQLIENKGSVEGSKDENRFLIIFNLFQFCFYYDF